MKELYYRMTTSEVLERLGVKDLEGLSREKVEKRRERDGYNEFKRKEHSSLIAKFFAQFKSFMIIVLVVAAIVSGVTGYMNGEGITDALIIMVILILNAIIGVMQESKAEKSLEALERMSAPHCKVIREGELRIIESRELVVGDIVVLEAGDSVPADLRLTECAGLQIQEAALTGESQPVAKSVEPLEGDCTLGDRVNMAFSSCSVTAGRGRGVVVAIGSDTEVGHIASMIESVVAERTPMQRRLDQLGRVLAIICLVVCGIIFAIGLAYGNNFMDMFMTAVSLAVAAIPEGLPAVSTVVLALGVQRLAKRNAIVRNLPSVETLGSTTVICSDKTGTLTQNRMTVVDSVAAPSTRIYDVALLCSDVKRSESGELIGDPTETALVVWAEGEGHGQREAMELYPRISEIPFDSQRKLMTTLHRIDDHRVLVATKGGFDELMAFTTHIVGDDGTVRRITEEDVARLAEHNGAMAERALRVLALAYAEHNVAAEGEEHYLKAIEELTERAEQGLTFVGMVGMIDPPRKEAMTAVAECRAAGIKPVMITGDHKLTAMAIARQLGIMQEGDLVLTGSEVESLTDEELRKLVDRVSVYARVAPEHKVRIVAAFASRGNVVAMTGDGVNDAPALKLANIGVAMGITGTDVAKEASDVVLADDNFATIVSAVGEGRRIYDNLIKSIQFMISTNLGEIVLLLVAVLCNWAMPLLPIQLLFINLVCDSLPSLALSVDPAAKDIMSRRPVDAERGFFTRPFIRRITLQALIVGGASIVAYLIGLNVSLDVARTMTFAVMVFSQFTVIFSIRTGNKIFTTGFFTNRWLWLTILFVVVVTMFVMLTPSMMSLFDLTALDTQQWLAVAALSVGVLLLSELAKIDAKRA